jgi:hypothetical protein
LKYSSTFGHPWTASLEEKRELLFLDLHVVRFRREKHVVLNGLSHFGDKVALTTIFGVRPHDTRENLDVAIHEIDEAVQRRVDDGVRVSIFEIGGVEDDRSNRLTDQIEASLFFVIAMDFIIRLQAIQRALQSRDLPEEPGISQRILERVSRGVWKFRESTVKIRDPLEPC